MWEKWEKVYGTLHGAQGIPSQHAQEVSVCYRDRREKSGTVCLGELRLMTFMSLGPMSMIPALAGAKVVLPRNGGKLHWRPESCHALFCRTLDKV